MFVMKRKSINLTTLKILLRPETDLEHALLGVPEFQIGMDWGEPRFGHPEGKVAYHIREVLDNIDQVTTVSTKDRARLRIIAFAHDTFKYLEDRSSPRDWSRHHAAIAKEYMSDFTSDQVILEIIGSHDDAYYAWLNERKNVENLRHKTLESLTSRLDYCLQLFYLFFKCDSLTGDKTLAPVTWFESKAQGITITPIERK
jgi:hypothetical protein